MPDNDDILNDVRIKHGLKRHLRGIHGAFCGRPGLFLTDDETKVDCKACRLLLAKMKGNT